jgi:hypothetical protein
MKETTRDNILLYLFFFMMFILGFFTSITIYNTIEEYTKKHKEVNIRVETPLKPKIVSIETNETIQEIQTESYKIIKKKIFVN